MDTGPEGRFCLRCGTPLVVRQIDGEQRLGCPAADCGWVLWNNPVPVVAALVQCEDRDGKVLLARNRAWEAGKFALISGFLEYDEDPAVAVLRELREETALVGRVAGLIGAYPFPGVNQLLLVYHLLARGDIHLNAELAEYRLIEPARLRPWTRGTGPAVADWLTAQGFGPAPASP